MSSFFYGIRRLLLLNTASYSLGDFPLDRPLSISAPNNRGKSTAINALQFPFLSNMNDMSFPRSNEETRKYYFPYDNSFVISEIVTDTGYYVVGAVGKGQASGYEYQLFAYQSKLNLNDFLVKNSDTEDKQVRNYKELKKHLARRNVWLKALSPKQMRDALMGKTITLAKDEKFSIGVFRLRSMTDENYRLFIRVFKNLLHMNNVNLEEMKNLLIDVLLPGEGLNATDFMARYHLLNEEVEREKAKVETAINITPDVNDLDVARTSRDQAIGLLRALFPRITDCYDAETKQRVQVIQEMEAKILSIEPAVEELEKSRDPIQKRTERYAIKEDKLTQKLDAITRDEARFVLDKSVELIEERINSIQAMVEQLIGELQQSHPEDLQETKNELRRVKQEGKGLDARMSAIDNNLLSVLTRHFDKSQIQVIASLINRDLLSALPLGEDGVTILDEEQLIVFVNRMISQYRDGVYNDGHISIKLDKLQSIDIEDFFNRETIQAAHDHLKKRRKRLEMNLEVAQNYKAKEKEKNGLQKSFDGEKRKLAEYQTFLKEKEKKADYEKDLNDITSKLKLSRKDLSDISGKILELSKKEQTLQVEKEKLNNRLKSLRGKYAQVVPVSGSDPMGIPPVHRLPTTLEEMLDMYIVAHEENNTAQKQIAQSLQLIESKNGLRFTSGGNEEVIINELLAAIEGIEEFVKQQDNLQRDNSREIGALLKELTGRFYRFKNEIRRFNREMNSRTISNIKRVEFIIDKSNNILEAVEKIVSQEDMFCDPDNVHLAIRHLDELVTQKGVKLSLENMFNMGIKIELEGGKVSSSYNDANIESTGTGLTVNIILNVMLLKRLLLTKRGQIINIPIYIDEAGQIDHANQQALIDQCLPAGFVPVFTSVDAQDTADYWIALSEFNGRIYIDREDWFRLSKHENPLAESGNA